jgi:hypothetical protein
MIDDNPTVRLPYQKYADLRHFTRNIPDRPSQPSSHVTTHVEAIYNSALKRGNGDNGDIFEVCFIDAMLKFNHQGATIAADKISTHVDVVPPKHAEADIWIRATGQHVNSAPMMLMLKTSLRERYKQEDRDAMIAKNAQVPAPRTFGIVLAETYKFIGNMTASNLDKEKKKLMLIKQRCQGIDNLFSAYDQDAMLKLFRAMAAN